jgi:2-hydroxy-6-oxonona-2,4-dienedioate hydrolase
MSSIYRTSEAEAAAAALYEQHVARLGLPAESRTLPTRFGPTHLLVAGPPDGPPLVAIHGLWENAAHHLASIRPLADHYRLYALDTIGQSVRSAPAHLSPRENAYGQWLCDLLDGLRLQRPAFIATSFGAGVLLRLAAVAPERISRAVLVVPASIANGPRWQMLVKLALPILRYRLRPDRERLRAALAPLMTEPDDGFTELAAAVLPHLPIRPETPPLVYPQELKALFAPVLLFAAKDDLLFPADRVIPRAHQLFHHLADAVEIPGYHLPSRATWSLIHRRAHAFLKS